MQLPALVHGSAVDPRDVEHLRDRVRLFLQVMLSIDVIAYISDYVSPLFIEGLAMPEYPPITLAVRYGGTALVAGAWAFARFGRPGALAVIALESAVSIGLPFVYIHIASVHMSADEARYAPMFAMFGIILLLSVRASLVPSPVIRTVVIGLATQVCLFTFGRASIATLDPLAFDGLSFIGGAFVLATAVTSHVIYGLRREVRQALQLGQYTLDQPLGEGGMGTVYRARHAMLRRQAAIKLIKPSQDGGWPAGARERFEREADATASLRSPHTVELYDFGVSSDGAFYYVMELLDGINLDTAVSRYGPMPPGRVVFLMRQVCESLEEAHTAGLVHRDIKPANIFLCQYGLRHDFIKVLDFGLVALGPDHASENQRLTTDGAVTGTPAYLAPEAVATPDRVDAGADIYAMGCVMFWLLTGRTPFERDTAMATILAHVNEAPMAPSRIASAVPPFLDAIVLECLAKDPARRPPSAAELSKRLQLAVPAEGWGQAKAEEWWAAHAPAREAAVPAAAGEAITMTRAISE